MSDETWVQYELRAQRNYRVCSVGRCLCLPLPALQRKYYALLAEQPGSHEMAEKQWNIGLTKARAIQAKLEADAAAFAALKQKVDEAVRLILAELDNADTTDEIDGLRFALRALGVTEDQAGSPEESSQS